MSHFEVKAHRDGNFTLRQLQKPFRELELQLDELEDLLRTVSAALGVAPRPPGPAPQSWPPPPSIVEVEAWDDEVKAWKPLHKGNPAEVWMAADVCRYTHWIPALPAPEDWPRPLKGDALTEAAEAATWACERLHSAWARSETGCYEELCKLRDTVRFAAAHAQQAVMDAPPAEADQLDAIREALLSYQCAEAVDDEGDGLPLADCLSSGITIDSGRREIDRLAEHLWDTTDASVWGPAAPDPELITDRDLEEAYAVRWACEAMAATDLGSYGEFDDLCKLRDRLAAVCGQRPAPAADGNAESLDELAAKYTPWMRRVERLERAIDLEEDDDGPVSGEIAQLAVRFGDLERRIDACTQAPDAGQPAKPEWSAEGWLSFVRRSQGWIAKRDGEPVFGGGVYFPTLTEAIRAAADDIPF